MLFIYNIGIRLYFILIAIFSLFNKKAKLWIAGRKQQHYIPVNKSAWFHFASLGEFEQGRPVLEEFRRINPQQKIVVTFFSPSGYEIRKNTPLADAVYYLPLDTRKNAADFIKAIDPAVAVFTKYEYWFHFFNELNRRDVPLYLISAIFRPNQVFFKWYGSLHRKMLGFVDHFFVQDNDSEKLLQSIRITNVTISGDTRFDRVFANALHPKELPVVRNFRNVHKVFICGSTWPEDETLLAQLVNIYPDWKFIFAPHEISEDRIVKLIEKLPLNTAVRYSTISEPDIATDHYQSLIIDNIGMLSSIYQYGEIAYTGGGFGAGIHNTLEAAAFGLPVIFGPNYSRFKEAKDLINLEAAFSIKNIEELTGAAKLLIQDEKFYTASSLNCKRYVEEQTGATEKILNHIKIGKQ